MSFDIITLLLIMGIVVGFVSGLLGIGGGIIIMPSLFFIYSHFGIYNGQQPIYCAINTSIFIVFISRRVQTRRSSINAYQQYKHHRIDWGVIKKLLPELTVGCLSGVILHPFVHYQDLTLVAGLILVALAFKMALPKRTSLQDQTLKQIRLLLTSFLVGAPSTLIGISGSSILVGALDGRALPLTSIPSFL